MADPKTRLFLITPLLDEAKAFGPALTDALSAGDIACVLVRHAARDDRGAKALIRPLVPLVQQHGAALLVEADPRLAAHADADGVQVHGLDEALDDAIERLRPERIVGCGGLALRDDAMSAGEKDLDYLMFGEPAPDGTLPNAAETLERVQWWAEIFNVPCVGYAQALGDVEGLATAGADFVALGDAVWSDPRGAAAAVRDAVQALQRASHPLDSLA